MELLFSDLGRFTLIYEKYRQILQLSNLCPLFKQKRLQRVEGGRKGASSKLGIYMNKLKSNLVNRVKEAIRQFNPKGLDMGKDI